MILSLMSVLVAGCGDDKYVQSLTYSIAKARGFWDTDEPCYQKTVLRVLSTMDNALPIFIYYLREKKILSPSFFIFIAAFKSLS